ncbi:ATP-binding protein [uncultured Friedmanniella sp.]|uniref:ATP-binding protein n=1 Tax=uncultured Friedmanniella sp. TaxID=335381 RepID=UPI0035CA8A9C
MVTRGRTEEVIPSAARLLGSLRDLGYDFVNAVADIVDNSVSAGATEVHVVLHPAGTDSWVRVADNGSGMAGATITEAMRLGTGQREYSSDELGKFGLGLKTASLSQARCITIASRTHPARAVIDCRRLDLDAIAASDRWEIEVPAAADRPETVVGPLKSGPGTVVLWDRLDRVLGRNDPFGGWSHRHLLKLAERLDQHLGMVFGRFLTGEARRLFPLTLTVNGTKVEAWDPFCLDERTEHLPPHELRVGGGLVRYRPYVLPPQDDFRDDETWRRASGPNQWNRQQGLYIYRADRMIQSGGWSWLRGYDEHIKLARAAVEFWPDLDEAFEINVAKTRVKLPEELRDQLKPLVTMLTRRADDRYRKSKPRRDNPAPPIPPRPTARNDANRPADRPRDPGTGGRPAETPQRPPGGQGTSGNVSESGGSAAAPAGRVLEETARTLGYGTALESIRDELRRRHPEVARDLGW